MDVSNSKATIIVFVLPVKPSQNSQWVVGYEWKLTHRKTGRSFVPHEIGPGSGVGLNEETKGPEGSVAPTREQLPRTNPADGPIPSAIHGWSNTRGLGTGSTGNLRCFGIFHELRVRDAGSFCFRAKAQGRGEGSGADHHGRVNRRRAGSCRPSCRQGGNRDARARTGHS